RRRDQQTRPTPKLLFSGLRHLEMKAAPPLAEWADCHRPSQARAPMRPWERHLATRQSVRLPSLPLRLSPQPAVRPFELPARWKMFIVLIIAHARWEPEHITDGIFGSIENPLGLLLRRSALYGSSDRGTAPCAHPIRQFLFQ